MEQENRRLRAKLEKLEKEHRDLKRAYFELSLRLLATSSEICTFLFEFWFAGRDSRTLAANFIGR